MDQYGNLPPTPASAHSYSQQTTPFPHPDMQHLIYEAAPVVPSPSQNTFPTNPIPVRLPPPSSMLPGVYPSQSVYAVPPPFEVIDTDSQRGSSSVTEETGSQSENTGGTGGRRRRRGKSPVDDSNTQRWLPKAITDLLTSILAVRPRYDNGAGGFKSQIWRVVKEQLEQQGHVRTVKQIQNKFAWIKMRWLQREDLLKKSGFGIDPVTKRVAASDECWRQLEETSPGKSLSWHKNNDFPNLDLCEVLFTDTTAASGRLANSADDVTASRHTQLLEPVVDSSEELNDNDGVDRGNGNDNDNGNGSDIGTGRKRSATTHDPKKSVNTNKRTRHMDEFNNHMSNLVEVLKQPIEVKPIEMVNPDERWVDEAHVIWERDFDSVCFEVANAIFDEWDEKPRKARTFVRSHDNFRRQMVAHWKRKLGVEDDE